MAAVFPELSVNISQKRWSAVLAPGLALSVFGLPLLRRLGGFLDFWVVRELWHILDNTEYYFQHPETLLPVDSQTPEARETLVEVLREWERARAENDPFRQHCYWVADDPSGSFLPEGLELETVWRYEALAAGLDPRIKDQGPLPAACRDAAALALALPSAFVLTSLESDDAGQPPAICAMLAAWAIPCREIPPDDPWQRQESEILRRTLVQAGLGKWVWSGFRPAVLHLVAPWAGWTRTPDPRGSAFGDGEAGEFDGAGEPAQDPWEGALGFWYRL